MCQPENGDTRLRPDTGEESRGRAVGCGRFCPQRGPIPSRSADVCPTTGKTRAPSANSFQLGGCGSEQKGSPGPPLRRVQAGRGEARARGSRPVAQAAGPAGAGARASHWSPRRPAPARPRPARPRPRRRARGPRCRARVGPASPPPAPQRPGSRGGRAPRLVAPRCGSGRRGAAAAGACEPDAARGGKMHPGTTPSAGAGLREPPPPPPRRLLAAVLWIQLALCFGPAQLTGDCRVPQIEDAEIRNKTYRRGDTLTVACHEGFRIRYPDPYNMVSLCRDDGTWDNLPLCQGCLRPLASSNGYMNVSDLQTSFPVGTVISYHCFPGFKLEGAESLECLHSLLWSSSPPRCLALEVCPLPPTVSHGDFICHPRPCERYSHGTVLEFYCDPGYSLTSDYKYITCQYGEWFPSYQVYCIKSEQTWPSPHETLLTTWKIVAFTATSVLLVLLLVILARMFQTKFKTHFPTRGPPRSSSSDPDFVVVDGVPVMLPSYDEAVSGGLGALGPGYLAAVGRGCPLPVNDQSPPAYPGSGDTDMGPGASEPCDSGSGPSELLQSPYPPSEGHGGPRPGSVDTGAGSVGEAASTSPGIDIADEIPLMEDDP